MSVLGWGGANVGSARSRRDNTKNWGIDDFCKVTGEMNVFESADARFEIAAKKLGLEQGVYRFLKCPEREITVYIPVALDSGQPRSLHRLPRTAFDGARPRQGRHPLRARCVS